MHASCFTSTAQALLFSILCVCSYGTSICTRHFQGEEKVSGDICTATSVILQHLGSNCGNQTVEADWLT